MAVASVACGYQLTWLGSKVLPLTSIAQTMRACLCPSATQAFCHPTRSLSLTNHWLILIGPMPGIGLMALARSSWRAWMPICSSHHSS
mgnify:CR=1 FL=1